MRFLNGSLEGQACHAFIPVTDLCNLKDLLCLVIQLQFLTLSILKFLILGLSSDLIHTEISLSDLRINLRIICEILFLLLSRGFFFLRLLSLKTRLLFRLLWIRRIFLAFFFFLHKWRILLTIRDIFFRSLYIK